jgi:hypothetical protein
MKYALALLLVLAAITGGWAYYARSVAPPTQPALPKQKLADWTPERIVERPDAYLQFCEGEVNESLTVLKARQAAIDGARARFNQQRDRETGAIGQAEPVLKQLQALAAADQWPATFAGQARSKPWVKNNIIEIEAQIDAKKKLIAVYEDGLNRLTAEQMRNPRDQSAALQQLAQIRTSREFLKIHQMNEDYSKRLVEMRSMVQDVITSASPTGVVALDELVKNAANSPAH